MASTIESVDNVRKPPPHDRINEAERSSSEHQRRQFKKTMKETMKEDKERAKKDQEADAVIIGEDQTDQEQNQSRHQEAEPSELDEKEPEDNQKDKKSEDGHIDLKA
jgi:hypothetical protein